jgi:hypothetical protein
MPRLRALRPTRLDIQDAARMRLVGRAARCDKMGRRKPRNSTPAMPRMGKTGALRKPATRRERIRSMVRAADTQMGWGARTSGAIAVMGFRVAAETRTWPRRMGRVVNEHRSALVGTSSQQRNVALCVRVRAGRGAKNTASDRRRHSLYHARPAKGDCITQLVETPTAHARTGSNARSFRPLAGGIGETLQGA